MDVKIVVIVIIIITLQRGELGIGGDDSTKEVGRGRESMVRSVCVTGNKWTTVDSWPHTRPSMRLGCNWHGRK